MTARIVVIDDEADIRRLISFTLSRRGHEVIEAGAGDVGLALVRQERPDLVILDVRLPGMDGLTVARSLASDPETAAIPILIASGMGQAGEIAAGLSSGARGYLLKPFSPRELADRVAELLSPERAG